MFSKATANFVRHIDPEGSLIHVSRINDSHKLVPMALVVRRNRPWFWQKPKYQPTDFTLRDLLLQGGEALSPGVTKEEFLTYKGTYGDNLSSKLQTEAGYIGVGVEGKGSSKLHSCFGKMNMEELDVKELVKESSDRKVNMQHVLVKQLKKKDDVLAMVTQRIFTTNTCTITHTKKEQCTFQGVLGLVGLLGNTVKVCVNDRNNIESDSDISLEIPPGTVIAYSVRELEIKKNGHYAICLQPDTIGSIEEDSPESWLTSDSFDSVDGMFDEEKAINGSQETDLSPLAELLQSTRHELFRILQQTLRDRGALSHLQFELERMCSDETQDAAQQEEMLDGVIVPPLATESHAENGQCGVSASLKATHLLVSAMEVLPDQTLSLLIDSSPDFLEAFDTLMCKLKESSDSLPVQCLPVPLQDNQAFQLAEQLLSSIDMRLKRDTDRLWTETGSKAGVLPVVLRLTIHGLSSLCKGLKY